MLHAYWLALAKVKIIYAGFVNGVKEINQSEGLLKVEVISVQQGHIFPVTLSDMIS